MTPRASTSRHVQAATHVEIRQNIICTYDVYRSVVGKNSPAALSHTSHLN